MLFFDDLRNLSFEDTEELYSIVYVCWGMTPEGLLVLERWEESKRAQENRAYPHNFGMELWWSADVHGPWDQEDMADCGRRWSRQLSARRLRKGRPGITETAGYQADLQAASESLWLSFLRELQQFACSDPPNPKYADLLAKLRPKSAKSQIAITSTIASVMAVRISVEVSLLVSPLVAIGLLALGRFGREQFCIRLGQYLRRECDSFGLTVADVKSEMIRKGRPRDKA